MHGSCLARPQYLVRAEYIRMYDFVAGVHNGCTWDEKTFPWAVAIVIGQPGVGKTTWIDYAIQRRLADGETTLLHFGKQYFLYGPDGVYQTTEIPYFHNSPTAIWCFLNADGDQDGLPMELTLQNARVFPIYVTSPTISKRWKRLQQSRGVYIGRMNPWCWDEMEYAIELYDQCRLETVRERFYDLGPMPRLCLEFDEDKAQQYLAARNLEIDQGPDYVLQHLIKAGSSDDASSKYFLIRRQSTTNMWRYVATVTSPTVLNLIVKQLTERSERDFINWWKNLYRFDACRVMCDAMFGAYLHGEFRNSIDLSLQPMFPHLGQYHLLSENLEGHPELFKSHRDFIPPANKPPPLVVIQARGSVLYDQKGQFGLASLSAIEEDVYYQFYIANQVGIDAFIVHGGHLYLLKFTMGMKSLCIKASLEGFMDGLQHILPTKDKWHFVFVMPDDDTLLQLGSMLYAYTAPAPIPVTYSLPRSEWFRWLRPYTARIPMSVHDG